MRSLAVSGSPGKDVQIKIDSVEKLPDPFKKFLRKTIAYSKIPEFYGSEWNIEKVLKTLEQHAIQPIYYSYGGRAPHVAYGVSRLGGDVRLITVFGNDLDKPYPGFFDGGYWSHLIKSGVKMELLKVMVPVEMWKNQYQMRKYLEQKYAPEIYRTDAIQVVDKEMPTIICCKDPTGIDFYYIDDISGAAYLEVARPAPRELLAKVDAVFITTSERPFMEDVVITASDMKKEVIMDIGSYGVSPDYLMKTVPLTKVIFGNTAEIKQVSDAFQVKNVEEIFSATKTNFPEVIILEDKFNGLAKIFTRKGDVDQVGPIPLDKKGNSVGCCDGIAAGFLAFYQRGFDLETCVRAGLIVCSYIWEVEGVQEGIPNKPAFYDRFTKYFGLEYSLEELRQIRGVLGI